MDYCTKIQIKKNRDIIQYQTSSYSSPINSYIIKILLKKALYHLKVHSP